MNGVLAIIRKELSHYFFAPMAYIVMGSFLLMNGFVFYVILAAVSSAGSAGASPMAASRRPSASDWRTAVMRSARCCATACALNSPIFSFLCA